MMKSIVKNIIITLSLIYIAADVPHFFGVRINYDYLKDIMLYSSSYESSSLTYARWVILLLVLVSLTVQFNEKLKLIALTLLSSSIFALLYELRLTHILRGSFVYDLYLMEVIGILAIVYVVASFNDRRWREPRHSDIIDGNND